MSTNFPCGFPQDDEPLMDTAIWPRESPVSNTAEGNLVGVRLPPSLLTESQSQSGISGRQTPDASDDDDPLETARGRLGEVTNFPCGFPWERGVAA